MTDREASRMVVPVGSGTGPGLHPDADPGTAAAPPAGPTTTPPVPWRETWRGPTGVAAGVILLLQLVWRAIYLAKGYYTQDDFVVLHLARTSSLTPHYLFQDYSGHLFPGGFAIAFLEAHLFPLSWTAAWVPTVILQLAAAALMWILLSRLLGDRWERVPLLAVFCLCPLTLWSTQWWIVSIHFLPTELCTLAALLGYLWWRQDGDVRGPRLTVLFAILGLLFQERSILIPVVVLAVGVIVEPAGGVVSRLVATVRSNVRLWAALAAALVVYLVVHARLAPVHTTAGGGRQPWQLIGNFFFRNLFPGVVGGPWTSVVLPDAAVIPPTWVVVVSVVLVIALVVFTARYGGTTARVAWLVLLLYAIVDVALLFGGRAQFGGILGLTPRYTADMVLVLVVVVAGAIRDVVPPTRIRSVLAARSGGRARMLTCIVVAVVYLASAAITSHHIAPGLYNTASRTYVENLRQDLTQQPNVVLYDSQVPADVLISWFGADDRVSTVLGVIEGAPAFDTPSEQMRVVDADGHIRQIALADPVAAQPGPNPQCGYNVTLTPTVVEMEGRVLYGKNVMQLAYFTNVADVAVLTAGGQTVQLPVSPGLHSVSIVLTTTFTSFTIALSKTGGTLCLGAVKAGAPRPTEP